MKSLYGEKEPHKADCQQVEYCNAIDRTFQSFGRLLESYETASPEARDGIIHEAMTHEALRIDVPECHRRLDTIQNNDPEPCVACVDALASAGMAVGLQLISLQDRFKDSQEDRERLRALGDKVFHIFGDE